MGRKAKNPIANNPKEMKISKQEIQQIQHYSGIIPHPSIVEGYEKVCAGAADRILVMTENELKNKQELERMEQENINQCRLRILEIEAKNSRYGQVLGFIILFTMIAGGFFLVYIGRSIGGYATIVSSIMLGLAAVLYNKKIEKDKQEEKKEE